MNIILWYYIVRNINVYNDTKLFFKIVYLLKYGNLEIFKIIIITYIIVYKEIKGPSSTLNIYFSAYRNREVWLTADELQWPCSWANMCVMFNPLDIETSNVQYNVSTSDVYEELITMVYL